MKDYSLKFWGFLCVFLFASLLVGCDVEKLEYEDDDTYALFDRPAMSPATPEEIARALDIIAAGEPLDDIPWAYSIILNFLEVTVDPDDISNAVFTVQEMDDILDNAGLARDPASPDSSFVDEVLKVAIARFNTPGFDPQDPPKNAVLAALVLSLKSGSMERPEITSPDQVTGDTLLTHGDVLLLLVSIYQSVMTEQWENLLAEIVHDVLYNGFAIALHPFTHVPLFEIFLRDSSPQVRAITPIDDDEWHFVVGTFGNGKLKIYVDGVMEGEETPIVDIGVMLTGSPVRFGVEANQSKAHQYLGLIDEIAIFNRELSADEIWDIYQNSIDGFLLFDVSLLLYFHLDEGIDQVAGDVSGYENHGRFFGGAQWVMDGKIGKCVELSVGSYIEVSEMKVRDVYYDEVTLMAWIKTPLATPWGRVFDKSRLPEMEFPGLPAFLDEIIDIDVSVPHQGELAGT